ncbi:MAG TPA: glycosyltransferase family 2 protein [Bryobacteraceae bacterium]|nr:glycosyltransferase family 2 protein [Bryobacteraceae bacterium]
MIEALHIAGIVIPLGAAVLTLPGSLELLLVTVGGVLPVRRSTASRRTFKRLACVVPAHDEAGGIAACVASLKAAASVHPAQIVVVADNCTDETVDIARGAGARVLERNDPEHRGKGYALDFAFQQLLADGVEAVFVVDADSRVATNFIAEMTAALEAGAGAVQCRYLVANPGASMRTRLMNVALLAFNVLRPRGRDRWGLSAGLLGNGFGLAADTLEQVPYRATSVVEDLEYHHLLVAAGIAVRFVDGTAVYGDMPAEGAGIKTQRARWEGGRLRMIRSQGPRLAGQVLRGRARFIEPLLELLLLPLGLHVALVAMALASPQAGLRWYGAAGLALVGTHVIAAIAVGGGEPRDVAALALAPFYVFWKLCMLPSILRTARRNAPWVRTERDGKGTVRA